MSLSGAPHPYYHSPTSSLRPSDANQIGGNNRVFNPCLCCLACGCLLRFCCVAIGTGYIIFGGTFLIPISYYHWQRDYYGKSPCDSIASNCNKGRQNDKLFCASLERACRRDDIISLTCAYTGAMLIFTAGVTTLMVVSTLRWTKLILVGAGTGLLGIILNVTALALVVTIDSEYGRNTVERQDELLFKKTVTTYGVIIILIFVYTTLCNVSFYRQIEAGEYRQRPPAPSLTDVPLEHPSDLNTPSYQNFPPLPPTGDGPKAN